jgi:hypothetical protein
VSIAFNDEAVANECHRRELTDADSTAIVEAVVHQLLEHQPTQLVLCDAGFLLQPLDSAEGDPVRPLEFQILRGLRLR